MSRQQETKRRPTIYSLAELADVSPGTVSRVLNNRDKVKSATRAKILKLAHEIGLKPQSAVRNRKIAVITEPHYTDRFDGYSNTLTSHVALALSELDVSMLLPSDPVAQLAGYFIDGVIAITYDVGTAHVLRKLEANVPVVYLDHFEAGEDQYVVCSDHYESGRKAAACFVEHGLSHLGFIGGKDAPFRERLAGYKAAIEAAGLPIDNRLFVSLSVGDSLYMAVNRVVKNGAKGLFVPGTSMQAVEALHVLANVMGLKIPQDVSLIGGENRSVSHFLQPPMTTLDEPLSDMAKAAVSMVLTLADGGMVERRRQVFPVELIQRDSVAQPDAERLQPQLSRE